MPDASRHRWALPATCRGMLALALASGGLSCSTDTSGLARSDVADASAGAGSGAVIGSGGGASAGASTTGGAAGAESPSDEPTSGAIEIVHGVIDGGSLFVCLRDAISGAPIGSDTPEPSGGLLYGRGWSLPTTRWDVTALDVEVELFVALSELAPPTCSELRARAVDADPLPPPAPDAGPLDAGLAPPPFPVQPETPRRAGALRLAPGVVREGGHYALVAAGCTHPEGSSDEVCGPADGLFGGRQTLVLAEIASQLGAADGVLGLQFLNASRALSRADLVLQWESQREALRVSSDVGFAAVRPRDAASVDDEPVGLELHVRGEALSSFTQAWREAVESSSSGEFSPGSNYLAVYVGPLPGIETGEVSPPRFVLIRGRSAPDGAALAQ